MSATSGQSNGDRPPFTLQFDANGNLADEDAKDRTITDRFGAKKRLTVTTLGEKNDLNEKLADTAIELAQKPDLKGKRIVVFVRSPNNARDIAEKIRNHAKPGKSKSNPEPNGPYANSVEVLTGTMRGLERDELVKKPVLNRFLDGDENPDLEDNKKPVFLVSTSAGEVGFDLNADHLVGDAAPLDSWIQRLGRVNRRGKGTAIVQVFVESPTEKKTKENGADKHTIASASAEAIEVLTQLPAAETLDTDNRSDPILDASPRALRNLPKPDKALSPAPTTVELTDILLDAWSMTSIDERMPGRPEVGPWLRGIDEERAETTIAWRAELELLREYPNLDKALKAIFAKHRVRPHESITTYSYRVIEFLKEAVKPKGGRPDLIDTPLAIRLPRGEIVIRTVGQLIDDPAILYAEPTLILPATFGGLDDAGMLSASAIPATPKPNDPPLRSLDVADCPGYERRDDATPRLRIIIRRAGDGNWVPESLAGGIGVSERLDLEEIYDSSTALFTDLRKQDLRIRLVQPIELDEEGDAVRSLVMLAPVADRTKPEDQSLEDHVGAVEKEAKGIADRLDLKDPFRAAFLVAAKWHDEGKKADIWQRFVYGPESGAYKGKSSKTGDPKSLRGYRHEFGSLLRLNHPERHKTPCILPMDAETRDLALHMIATHHGFGRPHFQTAIDRDFRTIDCDAVHIESIRRFARLQRKYGWWHLAWLENLLRCADALASADPESEDDPADPDGGGT
jgi:CRISPR-associated endonuclease/helicase Cas3